MGLTTKLITVDVPLCDEELSGLLTDYNSFVTSMTTKTKLLFLDDVFVDLVAFEASSTLTCGQITVAIQCLCQQHVFWWPLPWPWP